MAYKYFFSTTIEQNSNLPPQFSETASKKHILYGETNDYPEYLIELMDRASTHGAIIKGKHRYIMGQGFEANQELPADQLKIVDGWMKSVNEYGMSLKEVISPAVLDWLIYGGMSFLAVSDVLKKTPKNLHHRDFADLRRAVSDDTFFYSKYWVFNKQGRKQSYTAWPQELETYPRFKYGSGKKGILYFTDSRAKFRFYPLPEYMGCIQDIETEILISEFHNNNVKSGFSAGFIIEFTNGIPSEDEKAEIEREIKEKFTQARNAGELFITFTSSKDRGVNVIPIRPNDVDKQFEILRKDVTQSIITNHGITSPMLMAIKTEGQLGGNNEILTAAQLFQNTYVTPKQQVIEEFVNKWFYNMFGFDAGIYIVKLQPVKETLSLSSVMNDMTQDERRQMAGLPPLTKEQKAELDAKAKEEAKSNQLKMSVKLSNEDGLEELFAALKKCAIDLDGEILAERDCSTQEDFERVDDFEKSFQAFASVFDLPYYQGLVYQFLDANKDGKYSIKQIADRLLISEQQTELALKQLQEQNYLNYKILKDGMLSNFMINPVSDAALKENVPAWSIETRWMYSGPNDSRTRPFCYRMLNEEGLAGKMWKRQDIDKLTRDEGRNVWLTRGGWYTLPNGNKRPSCRHVWKQVLVKVKSNELKFSGFDPGQPRDKDGKWTDTGESAIEYDKNEKDIIPLNSDPILNWKPNSTDDKGLWNEMIAKLEEIGFKMGEDVNDMQIAQSHTNAGDSYYIYPKGKNGVKIRISDHSVGTKRFLSEYHVNKQNAASVLFEVEVRHFKNRFQRRYEKEVIVSNIEIPENKLMDNDKVISKRTSNAGKTIYNIERTYVNKNIIYVRKK